MMNFAHGMILLAALLPFVTVGLAKSAGIDNAAPRNSLAALSGWRQRADWAHRNHFEAFAIFAVAVLVAEAGHAAPGRVAALAGAFIVLRIVYTALYLANLPTLRSISWALAFLACLWLFVLGI